LCYIFPSLELQLNGQADGKKRKKEKKLSEKKNGEKI